MLKRISAVLAVLILSVIIFSTPVLASEKVYDYLRIVKLYIGEKEAEVNFSVVEMDQAAFVNSSRTLVPFRFLGESLGADIAWDPTKNQASLRLLNTEVKVIIGSKTAYVDGEPYTLDVPAQIKGGRTFIPLRFVSEALGAQVDYDNETKLVVVTYVDTSNWKEYIDPETGEASFIYPPDWTVTEGANGIVYFTSPNGSYVWQGYMAQKNVQQTVQYLKEELVKSGYTFESESALGSDDPAAGVLLIFSDDSADVVDYIYVLPQEGSTEALVVNETIKNGYLEIDDPIIMTIAFTPV